MCIAIALAGTAASSAVLLDKSCPADPQQGTVAATAPATSAPAVGAARSGVPLRGAGTILVYVERAPQNAASYINAVLPIIRGIVAEHGNDTAWVVLYPNSVTGPVICLHGQALAQLPDLLDTRMGTVGNLQFEYGLKRALELVDPDTELVLISANLALADMTDADRAVIKGLSASRVVDAISFGDSVDPPIDFAPLVSGRAVAITDGRIPRHRPDHPATDPG